ncbi:solute carrier family 23 member 1-like [Penaeus chinensis]|uniref:solute carrier family 23 member 1-like n=1 Tax=Penaeus chinensis TaxID=139456 RepID=UPI001FB6B257|nr:solute carrier family 23 member 1-like [Penaeus chinensis]
MHEESDRTQEKTSSENNEEKEIEERLENGETEEEKLESDLLYTLEEVPPWYMSFFFGFQHYLTMAGGTIAIPFVISPFLCLGEEDPARGALVSTIFFHSGLITLLQTTFGVRLPIIQGGDFAYLVPTISILTTSFASCETLPLGNMTETAKEAVWQGRFNEIQGALTVAAVVQVLLGFTGAIGFVLTWITPLAIVPTVTLVGLSLFDVAIRQAAQHWGISVLTMVLMVLFSQYLRDVAIPVPVWKRGRRVGTVNFLVFKCFPVLLSIFASWTVCAVLTSLDVFPRRSPARTDATGSLMANSPWFRIPYPGQWGMPSVSAAGVVGMLAGTVASIIESVGDYYACARITGAPPPPTHAINRGIGIEGLGCVLAGLMGTGSGTSSCSQNIGAISITKVGSLRVVQYSAVIMIVCGMFGKFGALFVTVPEPVVAGVFVVMFAMITAVGVSTLQYVDLGSSRNLFVFGISVFLGLGVPKWLDANPGAIQTGSLTADQVISVLLRTPMFVGGVLGFFLDNTIPGTDEERGIIAFRNRVQGSKDAPLVIQDTRCYDIPVGMDTIKRIKWLRWLPFSPTFRGLQEVRTNFQSNKGKV